MDVQPPRRRSRRRCPTLCGTDTVRIRDDGDYIAVFRSATQEPHEHRLWVAQALLAVVFFGVGFTKLRDDRLTYARARPPMTSFAEGLTDRMYKTLGVLEVCGAIGVIVPRLLGIAPVLTPLAALGFVGLMIGAIGLHRRRDEPQLIVINVVLMLLALFVAWGRGVEVLLGNDAGT